MEHQEFDLQELMEEVAIECADLAKRKRNSVSAFSDPEMPRMYFSNPDEIHRRLKNAALDLIMIEGERDIAIEARRAEAGCSESASSIKIDFTVNMAEPGGGNARLHSLFRLELIAAQNQPPMPQYLQTSAPLPIFILSSESPPNKCTYTVLRHWGLRCDGATSIREAISEVSRQAALEQAYRVILVSDPLPDGTAFDFAHEIRTSALGSQTRLVFVARYADEKWRELSFKSGFDAYLPKPFRCNQLLELLVELIGGDELIPMLLHNPPQVLVAEDNLTNQKIATLQLRRLGITPDIANNGLEALKALANKRYDLVLLDFQMPVLDGYETLIKIREQPHLADLPVVMLSCVSDPELIAKCAAAGMSEFVAKPVAPQRMNQLVAHWCDARRRTYFRFSA